MATLTLENMDEATLAALQARANEHGLSIEDYLKAALVAPEPPNRAEAAAQINAIRARTVPAKLSSEESTTIIREMRTGLVERNIELPPGKENFS